MLTRLFRVTAILCLGAESALANVVGNDAQNFNPVTGNGDFVTVNGVTTLKPGRFSLGLFLDAAANTLPYEHTDEQRRSKVNDLVTGAHLLLGAGAIGGLEFGLAFPFVVSQQVKEDDTRGEFAARGNTEIRPVIKWAFYQGPTAGVAVIASANFNRLQEDPHTGSSTKPTINGELAFGLKLAPFTLALNAGYRGRQSGEKLEGALIDPLADRLIASGGINAGLTKDLSLVLETYGARPVKGGDNETNRKLSSVEGLAGLRFKAAKDWVLHGGAGTEFIHGLSTPDWRLYAGVVTELGFGAKDAPRKKAKAPATNEEEDHGPGADEVPTTEPDEVFILNDIKFEFDSDYRALPGAFKELEKLRNHIKDRPYSKIVVEGHTDYMGTDEYNDKLSLRRARTVRRQLIKYYQLDPSKIIAVGHGERQPRTDDTSDAGRQLNRRVEIKIFRD